jgi:hypothetical protein
MTPGIPTVSLIGTLVEGFAFLLVYLGTVWIYFEENFALSTTSTRPYFLYQLYEISAVPLYLFGSRTTWRTQAFVLGTADDGHAIDFKRAVQDECTMKSVAVSTIHQI